MHRRHALLAMAGLAAAVPSGARAQEPFRIGLILPLTGPYQPIGRQIDAAVRLYVQQAGDVVAGRKIQVTVRDDAGVADTTRRLAQELVVREKVHLLAGFGLTPCALAAAPVAAQAKVPQIVMSAATSSITQASPFVVRSSQTLPQVATVGAEWAYRDGVRRVVSIVTDYGPGIDTEKWFGDRFRALGGSIVESLRVPMANPDFAPFLQRARDAAPEAIFVFVPAGIGGAFVKQFVERGMDRSGIRFLATGDVTDDDLLEGMGDVVLGVVTFGPYSAAHPSAMNRAWVADFRRAFGMRPNFMAVFGRDGMQLVYRALEKTGGRSEGAALVEAMKGMSWESPRGPFAIDPATRDVVHDIYIRRVGKLDGELYNVEFETFPNVRDPAKP